MTAVYKTSAMTSMPQWTFAANVYLYRCTIKWQPLNVLPCRANSCFTASVIHRSSNDRLPSIINADESSYTNATSWIMSAFYLHTLQTQTLNSKLKDIVNTKLLKNSLCSKAYAIVWRLCQPEQRKYVRSVSDVAEDDILNHETWNKMEPYEVRCEHKWIPNYEPGNIDFLFILLNFWSDN